MMMAERVHLYPYRTQKLSAPAVTIAGLAPVKIAHCQLLTLWVFFSFFFVFAMLYLILIGNIEINKMLSQNGELRMKKLLVFGLTAMMIIAIGATFVFVMLH